MSSAAERLTEILEALRVGIIALDPEGRIEVQNAEASRILELSADTARGRRLEDLLLPEHPVRELLAQGRDRQREVSVHACTLPPRRDREPRVVDLTLSPIGLEPESEGLVLTLRDRTLGHELESLVDQRARSDLFGQLAAGFAHEVRNPLGGIRGAAELLLGKLEDAALQRYPALIRDETDRILRLLDDLSQFTRGRELRVEPLNLHRVLDDLLELQAQAPTWRDVEVCREYDPSIPELELDPDRIAQVFLNLLRNAVQAMDGKGRLLLRTRMEAAFHLPAQDARPLRMVRIDIEDNGPGIPEEDLPHIFTPFFTRRATGTGLGLAICQHWVVRHGGRIRAVRLPEGGTRMRVQLPIRRQP